MDTLEEELKVLIVETLQLEDIKAEEIDSEQDLFGDGLGLDSIDALELAMVIQKKYGVKTEAGDEKNREIFKNVRALATHVSAHRT